jgi:uncharacterized protein (UPF0332 family)
MDNHVKDLANYRLYCAKEDLEEAVGAFNRKSLRMASNRAYYSIFHSMRTVLALEGKDFKKHSAVAAYFNQHYIKTGLFPSHLSKLISAAEEIRNASDYDDFYIAVLDEVKTQIESAKLIFDLVEKYINNQE